VSTETRPRRFFRRRGDERRALTRSTLPSVLFPGTAAGEDVTPRNALAIADAYACVRVLADSAASLPLHVYRRGADGGRERAENAAAELLRLPAPAVTQAAFIGQLMAHLQVFGEAFVGKYRDADGQVFQLGMISPDRVSVEVRGGMPFYKIATEDGRYGTYGVGDVVHVKGLTLDGLRGVSPVRQAREALGLADSLAKHGSSFFRNGARPAGVLKIPAGPAQEEVAEELKGAWEMRHRGAPNAGRIAVLAGEAAFEAVSMPLADAQFLGQREHSTREVARIFRVPPWMIGADAGSSLTYSNTTEQARSFVTFSLRPWLVAIEQALAADVDLFPPEARTYPQFELEGLLRGDPAQRAAFYSAALNPETGWMDRSEVRRLEDLPAESPPARTHTIKEVS